MFLDFGETPCQPLSHTLEGACRSCRMSTHSQALTLWGEKRRVFLNGASSLASTQPGRCIISSLHALSGCLPGSGSLRGPASSLSTGACGTPESQLAAKFLYTPCLQVENFFFFLNFRKLSLVQVQITKSCGQTWCKRGLTAAAACSRSAAVACQRAGARRLPRRSLDSGPASALSYPGFAD